MENRLKTLIDKFNRYEKYLLSLGLIREPQQFGCFYYRFNYGVLVKKQKLDEGWLVAKKAYVKKFTNKNKFYIMVCDYKRVETFEELQDSALKILQKYKIAENELKKLMIQFDFDND